WQQVRCGFQVRRWPSGRTGSQGIVIGDQPGVELLLRAIILIGVHGCLRCCWARPKLILNLRRQTILLALLPFFLDLFDNLLEPLDRTAEALSGSFLGDSYAYPDGGEAELLHVTEMNHLAFLLLQALQRLS